MQTLVSILIPAFNAERWIADTIRSALAQTHATKEVVVVDDGSSDRTLEVARRFEPDGVRVLTQRNQGAAAARNAALAASQGSYIQWLDADDLLAPRKIELQLAARPDGGDARMLLSGPWAYFSYRPQRADFAPSALWADLAPVDWLLRKMGQNLHMQTATWLVSRELTEAAGPWDVRLSNDDDGEYFCRVLLASREVRFVPGAAVYYRTLPSARVSFIGTSDAKMDALLASMKLHIGYLESLEKSARVRDACLRYIENWSASFSPERRDIFRELESMAAALGGEFTPAPIRSKYSWLASLFGATVAWRAQLVMPRYKFLALSAWDQLMAKFEGRA